MHEGTEQVVVHAEEHAAHEHPSPSYWLIFFALLILTVIEVFVGTWFGLKGLGLVLTLVVLAVVKAGLVGLYFMHLRYERLRVALITVIPTLMGVAFVIGMVLFESWGLD